MQDDTAKIWKSPLDGFCLSSLIMGIIGVPFYFFLIPQCLAIVFGIVGLRRTANPKAEVRRGRWMSITGMVCGSIELLLAVAVGFRLFGF
jgi:hypothetical protein